MSTCRMPAAKKALTPARRPVIHQDMHSESGRPITHQDMHFESGLEPDELPHDAKLQAGYIRYIRILPTESPDGELRFETSIRRSPSPRRFCYSAISYSWGDPTPSNRIVVDGQERMIAKNLWHFLRQVERTRTAIRHWVVGWLWIDALCIDQSDARERTHQVGIMSKIFGGADLVISWLGPAYNDSERAMATITGYTSDGLPSKHPTLAQTELSEAICNLCERQYWQRLWVFQELRHAQHISLMCGDETIPWIYFTRLWRAIVDIATKDEGRSDRLNQSLATRMITLRSKPIDSSLWNLLKETRNLECADQRDRVYALLSVATRGHENIEADYNAYFTPLRLAHMILQNKYAIRPPGVLNDVLMDCEFLEDVFKMNRGDMLRYRRHDAGGHNDSEVRTLWFANESLPLPMSRRWWQMSDEIYGREGILSKTRWEHSCIKQRSDHENVSSHIEKQSSQGILPWSVWAEFHNQTAVARLLSNDQ
jgi:hypothetical protein